MGDVVYRMNGAWDDVMYGMNDTWGNVMYRMNDAWVGVMSCMNGAWGDVMYSMIDAWGDAGSPVPPISPVSPVNLLYFGNPNFASYIFQKTPVSPVFSKYSPRTSYKKMKKFPAFYKYHKSL